MQRDLCEGSVNWLNDTYGEKKKKEESLAPSSLLQARVTAVSVQISAAFKIAWFFTLTEKRFDTEYISLDIMRFLNSLGTLPT